MARITADSMIQSLTAQDPGNPIYQVLYLLNKDLQDARATADKVSSIITMATTPQPPGPSNNAQAIVYFDPVTLKLMVSENGSPYDYLVQNAPACILATAVAQSIATDTYTQMTFAASDVTADAHGLFNPSTGKITFNVPGLWLVKAGVTFQNDNDCAWCFARNDFTLAGVTYRESATGRFPAVVDTSLEISCNVVSLVKAAAGDSVTLNMAMVSNSLSPKNTLKKTGFACRIGGSG